MRKAQKKQAEDFVQLLSQAHVEIKKTIQLGKNIEAMELLKQCQAGSIQLGNLIESTEGEGFVTTHLLEEYCELVYQIHEELASNMSVSVDKVYKKLYKAAVKIKNSIRNDIKIRLEVVFLPYKASMWDSLESVWKAADEDPDCDAYVIPIPYYDKNSDGSFGEIHYEGDEYPPNVPVTDYKKYDFEGRHPDIIFIHNPYDEYNFVTSILPYFYSGNLKKFTDNLVYIPYFILNDINLNNPKAVDKVKSFCTVMGVMNADKVIVQSEVMKQIYIDAMTECVGENTRKHWSEKILGLGSPKMDKIAEIKREDLQIPDKWMEIIKKQDGSLKKVVLYNTGVNALLKQGEKMLEKIEDVLCIFEENQQEIALLWRPHPLIHAAIGSMRPELKRKYDVIVKEYRDKGWGIYDDTADLDRAIAMCDAYYGDGSSVVKLCQEAGKPVMIQNVDIREGIK